ncbi:MAG: tetratricopeptide repeat protein [Deltaproteobacteria bacterium]|nr:tetratricopeptide repeat protein [Deltaproteobacteria bacterium]
MSAHRLHTLGAALIIAAAAFAVYGQTLKNGFVYDDNHIILANIWVTDFKYVPEILTSSTIFADPLRSASNTYRPFLFILFAIEHFLFGFNALGFHLLNVILHALNGILVFAAASFLLSESNANIVEARDRRSYAVFHNLFPPLLAGLVFVLHPVNSEVANWVSATAELSFTFLFLIAFYLYVRGGRVRLGLSIACFFSALLFKEPAIVLPALLAAYDIIRKGRAAVRCIKAYILFGVAASIYMVIRTAAVGGIVHQKKIVFSFYETVINIFPLIAHYLSKLLYPAGLNVLYEFHPAHAITDPRALAGILAAAVFAYLIFIWRDKVVSTALVLAALPILPVLYIPALSSAAVADRYLYLPSAGFALIIAYAARRFLSPGIGSSGGGFKAAAALFISAALLFSYSAADLKRSLAWRSDYTLWADTLEKSPRNPNAHYNFAWSSQGRGDVKSAIVHYKEAIRLAPAGAADAHYNLGIIYTNQFMLDEALSEFQETLSLNPGYADAKEGMNKALMLKNQD